MTTTKIDQSPKARVYSWTFYFGTEKACSCEMVARSTTRIRQMIRKQFAGDMRGYKVSRIKSRLVTDAERARVYTY